MGVLTGWVCCGCFPRPSQTCSSSPLTTGTEYGRPCVRGTSWSLLLPRHERKAIFMGDFIIFFRIPKIFYYLFVSIKHHNCERSDQWSIFILWYATIFFLFHRRGNMVHKIRHRGNITKEPLWIWAACSSCLWLWEPETSWSPLGSGPLGRGRSTRPPLPPFVSSLPPFAFSPPLLPWAPLFAWRTGVV